MKKAAITTCSMTSPQSGHRNTYNTRMRQTRADPRIPAYHAQGPTYNT